MGTRKNDGVYANNTAVVYPSAVHAAHMIYLFNEDVTSIQTGDALCVESSADETAKSSTTYRDLRKCVVLGQQISGDNVASTLTLADGSQEWFYAWGEVPGVQVTGTVVANEYLYFSTTARKLVGSGVVMSNAAPPQGAVGFALDARTGAGLVRAYLYDRTETKPLDNLTATTNPAITDDVSLGYSVGSLWINTTLNITFRCRSDADGAALWVVDGSIVASYATQAASVAEVTALLVNVPRKCLGANGILEVEFGVLHHTSGGGVCTFATKGYWGGVQEITSNPTCADSAANSELHRGKIIIRNINAANSQLGSWESCDSAGNTEGQPLTETQASEWFAGSIDTDAAEVEIKITITMNVNNANTYWKLIDGRVTPIYRA